MRETKRVRRTNQRRAENKLAAKPVPDKDRSSQLNSGTPTPAAIPDIKPFDEIEDL